MRIKQSTLNIGIGTNLPNSKLHVAGAVSLTSQSSHPAAYAGGGQVYCVSNEVYAMDASGNVNVLSPDPDWAGGKRVVMLSGNVYDGAPIEYVEADTLRDVLSGKVTPGPGVVKSAAMPSYMRRDWTADERSKVDAAAAARAAWLSDTNAVEIKGQQPPIYKPRPKPEARPR